MCAKYILKRPSIGLLLIVLVLVACGGGETPPAEPESPPEPTVAPTEAPTEVPATSTPVPTPSPEPTLSATERLDLGIELWDNNQLDEAVVELETAVSLEPENPETLSNLAGVYITLERYDEALEILNQAYAIDDDHPNTIINLCTTLALTGDESALGLCEAGLEIVPDSHSIPNALGIIAINEGRLEDAIMFFGESIALGADDGFAHNNLGFAYMELGEFGIAIEKLEEAVVVNPLNTQALYNRALAYAQDGQLDEAIEAYDATLAVDPAYDSAYFDLGIIYTQLDQPAEAISNFETFLELSPDDPSRDGVLAEINRLQGFVFVQEAIASPEILDFENPASVLQTIFYSAANEEYDQLAGLCDPEGQNDGDTALVCEITAEHENVGEFILIFANATINGPATISGDIAEIPFLFGENADVPLTMQLVLRDGKWYLFDF